MHACGHLFPRPYFVFPSSHLRVLTHIKVLALYEHISSPLMRIGGQYVWLLMNSNCPFSAQLVWYKNLESLITNLLTYYCASHLTGHLISKQQINIYNSNLVCPNATCIDCCISHFPVALVLVSSGGCSYMLLVCIPLQLALMWLHVVVTYTHTDVYLHTYIQTCVPICDNIANYCTFYKMGDWCDYSAVFFPTCRGVGLPSIIQQRREARSA